MSSHIRTGVLALALTAAVSTVLLALPERVGRAAQASPAVKPARLAPVPQALGPELHQLRGHRPRRGAPRGLPRARRVQLGPGRRPLRRLPRRPFPRGPGRVRPHRHAARGGPPRRRARDGQRRRSRQLRRDLLAGQPPHLRLSAHERARRAPSEASAWTPGSVSAAWAARARAPATTCISRSAAAAGWRPGREPVAALRRWAARAAHARRCRPARTEHAVECVAPA